MAAGTLKVQTMIGGNWGSIALYDPVHLEAARRDAAVTHLLTGDPVRLVGVYLEVIEEWRREPTV